MYSFNHYRSNESSDSVCFLILASIIVLLFVFLPQERLREERNKEYNLFLQEQAQKRGLKMGTSPVTSKVELKINK